MNYFLQLLTLATCVTLPPYYIYLSRSQVSKFNQVHLHMVQQCQDFQADSHRFHPSCERTLMSNCCIRSCFLSSGSLYLLIVVYFCLWSYIILVGIANVLLSRVGFVVKLCLYRSPGEIWGFSISACGWCEDDIEQWAHSQYSAVLDSMSRQPSKHRIRPIRLCEIWHAGTQSGPFGKLKHICWAYQQLSRVLI